MGVPRNYVVMEVKQNLIPAERQALASRFTAPHFKKIAYVVMGDPDKEFKKATQDKILAEKQVKATREWNTRKAAKENQKRLAKREKEMQENAKKALEAK